MKKLLILTTLLCTLLFIGCSKDDDPKFNYDLNTLYGKWKITHLYVTDGYIDVSTYPGNTIVPATYATFKADGTYSGSGYFGNGSGTYKAVGNAVTCYIEGKEYARYDVITLSGNNCELTMSMGSSSTKIKCQKQ